MATVAEATGAIEQSVSDAQAIMVASQVASAALMGTSVATNTMNGANAAATEVGKNVGNDMRHAARSN